jgi:superfamily II DNA/RNA helicase
MSKLLKSLLGLLFPGVDDPAADPGGDPAEDPAGGGDPAGDPGRGDPAGGADPLDDEFDFDFVEPTPRRASAPDPNDAAERLRRLEEEVERRGRAVDAGRAPTAAPFVDPEFQREEERLRATDITEQERWQIHSNRVLRDNQRLAHQALMRAEDLNDRTSFESKIAADPHRARYRDRVEHALAEERRQGRNASREAIYFHMLGKDIAEGKLKPKAKAKAPAADVPRGRTPAVRSNVSSGRGTTEHQKRIARLENQNI